MDVTPTYAAIAAGLAAPQPAELISGKDEAHGCNVGLSFDQPKTDVIFSLANDAERKSIATLGAVLALAGGHVLHQLADGSYLVTWRHLTRALPDLDAVAAFARQIGASK